MNNDSDVVQDTLIYSACIFELYFAVCKNNDCEFSHSAKAIASPPASPPQTPTPSRPCKYFRVGNCRRGSQCPNVHEKAPKNNGKRSDKGQDKGGKGPSTTKPLSSHAEETKILQTTTTTIGGMENSNDSPPPRSPLVEHSSASPEDQAYDEGEYPNDDQHNGWDVNADADIDEQQQLDPEHHEAPASPDGSAFGVDSGPGEESGQDVAAGNEEDFRSVNPNSSKPSTSAPHAPSSATQPQATPTRAPQVSLMTLHWCQFADPNSDRQQAFCKAFAQNKCSNVDTCQFRHCLTVQEFGQLFKDQQPLQFTLDKASIRNDSPANSTVITSPSITLHWAHYADPTCDTNIAFCKHYAQNACSNGNNCAFRHCLTVEEYTLLFKDPQPNTITTSGGLIPTSTAAPLPAAPKAQSRPPACSFFRKGTCKNGDQCIYYHSKDCPNLTSRGFCSEANCAECNQVEQKPGPPKRVCQYWPQGKCRNGEACPFAHEGESGAGASTKFEPKLEPEPEPEADNEAEDPPEVVNWAQDAYDHGWGPSNDASAWEPQDTSAWGQVNDTNAPGKANDDSTRGNDWNHANNNNSWNQSSSRPSRVCHNFQRDGQCSRGSGCRFSHDLSSGTGSRDSRDHSRQRGRSARPNTRSNRGGTFDPTNVEQWGRNVAESQAGEEPPQANGDDNSRPDSRSGQQRGKSPRRGARNRSVDPAGNGSCELYLTGRCPNGDSCPLSHDAAAGGSNSPDNEDREGEADHVAWGDLDRGRTEEDFDREERERALREDGGFDECIRDTVEEVAADDTNDQHYVFESNLDDQWESKPLEWPGEGARIDKPCLRYGQGHCPAGNECPFLHIDPDESNSEASNKREASQMGNEEGVSDTNTQVELLQAGADGTEANDYGHPLVEKSIFGCTVVFGRDCLPEKVTTVTDSHVLLLEASPSVTEARVHDVVNKYGAIEDIIIMQAGKHRSTDVGEGEEEEEEAEEEEEEETPPSVISVRVEFKEMKDAARAAKRLGLPLAGALAIEEASPVSTWVKFRWPQPVRAAWVHYPTLTKAKMMAEKLNGTTFQGKKITATFLRPEKRQIDLFAVKLERLPPSATREDLAEVTAGATLINVSELTYTDTPQDNLRELDNVKDFVGVQEDPTKINAIAFARFPSQETVRMALRMNGKKQQFLGKQELVVEEVWFSRYMLPEIAFKAVASEVKALHVQCEGHAHVEFSDHGDFTVVYVYAALEEREAFAKANLSLQAICRGTIVTTDNRSEWDDYFNTTSSVKAIENLNSKNPFYVFPDAQTRMIRVLGSGLDLGKGVSTIKKLLQKVRESCQEHTIHRNALQRLINGGLSEVQGDVGPNKLSLDVLRSVLIVRGSDAALTQRIRHILDYAPPSQSHGESSSSGPSCSVCELRPGGDGSSPAVELSCRHTYCVACLQHALISAAHDRSAPITCIGRVLAQDNDSDPVICGQPIEYTTVREILPLVEEPEYLSAIFASFVLAHPDEYFFCPAFRCEAVYRRGDPGDTIRCPICRSWNCLSCGSFSHDGINCDEAVQSRKNVRA